MIEISKYKTEIDGALLSHGIDKNDIILFACSDLDREQMRCDSCLLLTEKKLFVLEGVTSVSGKPGKNVKKSFHESGFAEFELSGLSDLSIDELVSSAMLTAKYNGKPALIAFMTKTAQKDIGLFVKYASKQLKGEPLTVDEEDFRDDRFCPKCGRRYPDEDRKICPH